MYSTAPFFRTYLEVLGVRPKNIVFSEPSSEEMFAEGGKYGSVDPCYPSKVAQAHFHQLLFHKHVQAPLDAIFFPILTHVPNFVTGTVDDASCPIVAGTPDVMKAAFTKEQDYFGSRGIRYLAPAFSFAEPTLLKRDMFEAFESVLDVTEDESDFAVEQGLAALARFDQDLQDKGRAILEQVEADDKVAILMLGRPYHLDPGLHHGIPDEFQVLGYPILSIRSIPKDRQWLRRFYGDDEDPLDINDVWPENYSANSAQKVWAARFASRHPNVAILDLSSFKCGHDAPTYGIIDSIVAKSGVPSSSLHDIDANKPGGSIKIRVKTYAHSLRLREEQLEDIAARKAELQRRIDEKRLELLRMKQRQLASLRRADLGLEREINELADKVSRYQVEATHEESDIAAGVASRGLIRLGRKTKDGKLVRV
jgi:predicted nucleotide-binding protein (sugar kinase/HSP70/actin superfamily)